MPSFSQSARKESEEDFDAILNYYAPRNFIESLAKSRELLRLSHRFAISLSQLVEAERGRSENEIIFLREISSDAIHMLHVLFQGDRRAALFYMRSCIENFWRHIYFRHHPVEYAWLHTRPGYFLTLESLRDYCKSTPLFLGVLKSRGGNFSNYFSLLSSEVHSTNAPTMVLRPSLKDIRLKSSDVSKLRDMLAKLSKDLLLVISVSDSDLFDAMTSSRRAYLMEFFDSARKRERQKALGCS